MCVCVCVFVNKYMKRTGFYTPFWYGICIYVHRNKVETTIVAQQTANKYSFVNSISLIPLQLQFFFLALAATFFVVVVVMCAPLLLCNNSSSQKVWKLHVCGLHIWDSDTISYTIHILCNTNWASYNLIFCVDVPFGCELCAHIHT